MRLIDLFRCELAMRIDALKDRVDALGEWVSPHDYVWDQYDDWARKRGRYDWYLKDTKP